MEGFRSLMTYCFLLSLSLCSAHVVLSFIHLRADETGTKTLREKKMYIQTRVTLFP